ncbi:MAG: hypothetical protein U0175_04050 [Caldilineaceae bacterium]
MFYAKKSSIAEFLIHGDHVLNFLESRMEAVAVLAQYGFGAAQMQEGRLLFEQAALSFRQVQEQRRKQMAATDGFHDEWKQVKQCYQVHLQAARRVLDNAGHRDAQHLLAPLSNRYAEWLEHARSFYSAMLTNPVYQEALRTVNISVEDLAQVDALLAQMVVNKDLQAQMYSDVRTTLQQRKLQVERSKHWFGMLMSTARIAFQDQPGVLAALVPGSVRTEAEREATRKLMAERRVAKKKAAAEALAQQAVPSVVVVSNVDVG